MNLTPLFSISCNVRERFLGLTTGSPNLWLSGLRCTLRNANTACLTEWLSGGQENGAYASFARLSSSAFCSRCSTPSVCLSD